MPRLRNRSQVFDRHRRIDVDLALRIGPWGGMSDDELRLVWELTRDQLMSENRRPGSRPWGYWAFEVGEEQPAGRDGIEAVRLAELGLLTDSEMAALHERANEARLRVGTGYEQISGGNRETGVSMDAAAVDLWERIAAVRSR